MKSDKEARPDLPQAEQAQNDLLTARDFMRGHMDKWLVERVNRARQCQRFEKALAAIRQNQSEQARELGMDLEGLLELFACVAVSGKRGGGRKSCEKMSAIGTGKTWKALAEFPERLRRMAKEVEKVNESQFFAPAMYIGTAKG